MSFILSVAYKPSMLNVEMLSVVMLCVIKLNVMAPIGRFTVYDRTVEASDAGSVNKQPELVIK